MNGLEKSPLDVVHKFPFPIEDEFELDLPYQAEILFVGSIDGQAYIWARVTPGAANEARQFIVRGTGDAGAHGLHIASFMTHGGKGVWHLFEIIVDRTRWAT